MMAIGRSLVFTGLSFPSSDRTAPAGGDSSLRGRSDDAPERDAGEARQRQPTSVRQRRSMTASMSRDSRGDASASDGQQ